MALTIEKLESLRLPQHDPTSGRLQAKYLNDAYYEKRTYINRFIDALIAQELKEEEDIIEYFASKLPAYIKITEEVVIKRRYIDLIPEFLSRHWRGELFAIICFLIGVAL